jgi:hypothetical protein
MKCLMVLACLLVIPVALFAQAPAAPAAGQTNLRHPKLNGLERGEMKRREMELTLHQNRLTADQKALTRAQAALAAADPAAQTMQAGKKVPLTTVLQQRVDMAQKRLTQDQTGVTRQQARVNDWTSKTLAAHGAPKGKVDWTKGTVAAQ